MLAICNILSERCYFKLKYDEQKKSIQFLFKNLGVSKSEFTWTHITEVKVKGRLQCCYGSLLVKLQRASMYVCSSVCEIYNSVLFCFF